MNPPTHIDAVMSLGSSSIDEADDLRVLAGCQCDVQRKQRHAVEVQAAGLEGVAAAAAAAAAAARRPASKLSQGVREGYWC